MAGLSITNRVSHKTAKGALLFCWAVAVTQIWLASDGSETISTPNLYDGFEPPILNRAMPTKTLGRVLRDYKDKSTLESAADKEHDLINSLIIPEALQPITYHNCCVPAILLNTTPPKDMQCFGTCYNERACSDPSYPYSSLEERDRFGTLRKLNEKERKSLRNRCLIAPNLLMPKVSWCSKPSVSHDEIQSIENSPGTSKGVPNNQISNSDETSIYGSIPSPGCSLVSNGGGSGPWQHVFVFPSAKLAFCGIPKVGITQWIQFVRFVAGSKDYPSLPHYKLDTDFFRFDKLDTSIQQEIWKNEKEWTWAVILRDPAERLLSAYLDKIAKSSTQDDIKTMLGINRTFTFGDFVERLKMKFNQTDCTTDKSNKISSGMTGLNWCSDPHWRPQIMSCGLYDRLHRFKFVGDISNIDVHTRLLLQEVDLWESHGKHFINGGITTDGKNKLHSCSFKSHSSNHSERVGFQQKDDNSNITAANIAYDHSRNSRNKMDKFYTPELIKIVKETLYADDDKLYQLVKGKNNLLDGKVLAALLARKTC